MIHTDFGLLLNKAQEFTQQRSNCMIQQKAGSILPALLLYSIFLVWFLVVIMDLQNFKEFIFLFYLHFFGQLPPRILGESVVLKSSKKPAHITNKTAYAASLSDLVSTILFATIVFVYYFICPLN